MKLQSPRFAGLTLVAAICLGALQAQAHDPHQHRQQQQQHHPHANAVEQNHHHQNSGNQLQAEKHAKDHSHHAPADKAGEEKAAWNHGRHHHHKKPKYFCSAVELVCDHVVLERILCPVDILPPIIMDGTGVKAEYSPEFSGQNNGKKPNCKVIGEPRYVNMHGVCYEKPPPICPIVLNDASSAEDGYEGGDDEDDMEDGNDEADEEDMEDSNDEADEEDVGVEGADAESLEEDSARLRKRHHHLKKRSHCRQAHKPDTVPLPHYGGNNDTWAGLCVQPGFFCADRLFACGLDPKVLYSCDKIGYPPNINATCTETCVNGVRDGQAKCDGDAPVPEGQRWPLSLQPLRRA
ncbi:hypothetical protein EMPS_02789 [Entomortierella parvispora]|uniref:Uncharacterized protein n=1 Tax=Entomortierella parvispora TaxID=205924 RepID=A0A9P3H5E3_9FUNG|nr:hypothetical protein EMPS_02789 [Entomortierella parvispora]